MTIWIDADGCPVVEETIRLAKQRGLRAVILCDTSHQFSRPDAETIVVSKGADSVDYALVNRLSPGDIAVTQDYGLAAMCLARGAHPISQNGLVFDDFNIGGLLEQRAMSAKLRRAGKHLKGSAKRTREQDAAFVESLGSLLDRLSKKGERL